MPEAKKAVRLVVEGTVQGVGYRAWAVKLAKSLGLAGWVRNCADGTVEINVLGSEETVRSFITLCHKGPLLARVKHVHIQDLPISTDLGAVFEQH